MGNQGFKAKEVPCSKLRFGKRRGKLEDGGLVGKPARDIGVDERAPVNIPVIPVGAFPDGSPEFPRGIGAFGKLKECDVFPRVMRGPPPRDLPVPLPGMLRLSLDPPRGILPVESLHLPEISGLARDSHRRVPRR